MMTYHFETWIFLNDQLVRDLNIIQHESLRKVISHGPKFREPQHINWKHNFKLIMDAVEDYARRWIKREIDQDPELRVLVRLG